MQSTPLAVSFMLVSTLSLSLSGLITKYLSVDISAQWLTFLRFFLPGLMLFIVMAVTQCRLPVASMRKPLVLRAFCMAGCQLCFIFSLQTLSLVESVVLFSTGPLFIPLLEKLFFRVKLQGLTLVGLAMTFLGVLLLAGDVSGIRWRPELLIGVLAGLFNAGSQLCLYRATKSDMRTIEINAWSFGMASLVLLPLLITSPISFSPAGDKTGYGALIVGAVLAIAFLVINTQVFRAKAYRIANSGSQLAPLIFTNLMYSAIWQMLFFDVSYSSKQIIGLALIVVATVITGLLPKMLATWHHAKLKSA
ncbi:DMT family transporter [Vibrio nitrifigilis]|uniref:DMT family transporter n=1 Tax=Vibrio nitrifigilis TaxID=2789781 RepID=A0ABS0GLB5_9VIBR|nr:DMT family transporter [Vibrio nitrifigilis]MBF9003243.1 DMT family transporter [Vibrio nitrifigilis]